jgi:hypothetical protein
MSALANEQRAAQATEPNVATMSTEAAEAGAALKELERLGEERDSLRKERDTYRAELKANREETEGLLTIKLKIVAEELTKKIKDDFFGHVKIILWVCSVLIAVATLGGLFSLNGMAEVMIDKAIEKRNDEFKRLRDNDEKLRTQAVEDIVKLRTQIDESKRLYENTRAEFAKLSSEMNADAERARKLILETTRYWEAAKAAIDSATEKMPRPKPMMDDAFLKILRCITSAGVKDADVDLFIAVIENDLDGVKRALDRGGNPVVTKEEILRRHRDVIQENCPGLLPR